MLRGDGKRKNEAPEHVLLKKWGPGLILKKAKWFFFFMLLCFVFRAGTISVCVYRLLIHHNLEVVTIQNHLFWRIHWTKVPIPLATYQLYVQRRRGTAQPE